LLATDLFQRPCEGVRLIHHNVQGLDSKLADIIQWLHFGYQLPIILCCSEMLLTNDDPVPRFDGFVSFCLPMLQHTVGSRKYFPGSTIKCLCPEHPPICDEIEHLCSSVDVCCCFATSKYHRIAIVSVYCSPSVPFTILILEFSSVLVMLSSNAYLLIGGDFHVSLLFSGDMTNEYISEFI